jgi:exodeoxyribonuclease V alpha subunit
MTFGQAQQQFAEIEAIDFYLAEQLVQSFMQTPDSPKELLVEHTELLLVLFMALSESLRQGHSCLPLEVIANSYWGRASDNDNIITQQGFLFPALSSLMTIVKQLHCNSSENTQHPVVFFNDCLYLRRYYCFEQELAHYIKPRLNQHLTTDFKTIKACLAQVFAQEDFHVKSSKNLDWQMLSVANALNKQFSIIAGGPGTGKTYTVTKILAAIILLAKQSSNTKISDYNALNHTPRIAMVAPTGKAAQRLSESINDAVLQLSGHIAEQVLAAIPKQAQTIHRLLGVIPQSIQFKHHQKNKLAIDVLLIDEVSMVDLALMTRIFRALPEHCQVILLGDADQLPSVMAGSILTELAPRPHLGYSTENVIYLQAITQQTALNNKQFIAKKSHSDHLTFLQKSRRFDGQGGIGLLAAAVIKGDSELSWQLLKNNTRQIERISTNINDTLAALVKQYYLPLLQSHDLQQAFTWLNKFRVLCVTRQGDTGVDALNEKIIQLLSDQNNASNKDFYHGQPIMIKENNYQMSLYNGDIGIIWRDNKGHLMAFFENNENTVNKQVNKNANTEQQQSAYRSFMLSQLPPNETVYAMTIHKTQGSEFDHVLMMLPEKSDHPLLSRELLYTGITRAKSQLVICSKANVWQQGVNKKVQRYANLAYRLFL